MTFSYELSRPSLHFVKNHPAKFPPPPAIPRGSAVNHLHRLGIRTAAAPHLHRRGRDHLPEEERLLGGRHDWPDRSLVTKAALEIEKWWPIIKTANLKGE
jgi:hypothetical protein